MTDVHMLRVFTDQDGNFGDLATVVIDEGKRIPDVERQAMARELSTGETIFINDSSAADISVMHPQGEIGFAGVGVLGAAWLLRDKSNQVLRSLSGDIEVWQEGEVTWARTDLGSLPAWNIKQVDGPSDVDNLLLEDTLDTQHTMVWAWLDEAQGLIRARTFASDWQIPEAEGNGSGAMKLAAAVNRSIEFRHGKGSVMFASPADNDCANIGGRVVEQPSQTT